MNSPFFTSGLAMWSPAPVTDNRTLFATAATNTAIVVTPTPATITLPASSFHHQPVYDPPACLVCGLPHPPQDTSSSYLLRDQSTLTPPEPSLLTPPRSDKSVVFIHQKPSPRTSWSWLAECVHYVRRFWSRFVYHKRLIYPSKRRYR